MFARVGFWRARGLTSTCWCHSGRRCHCDLICASRLSGLRGCHFGPALHKNIVGPEESRHSRVNGNIGWEVHVPVLDLRQGRWLGSPCRGSVAIGSVSRRMSFQSLIPLERDKVLVRLPVEPAVATYNAPSSSVRCRVSACRNLFPSLISDRRSAEGGDLDHVEVVRVYIESLAT